MKVHDRCMSAIKALKTLINQIAKHGFQGSNPFAPTIFSLENQCVSIGDTPKSRCVAGAWNTAEIIIVAMLFVIALIFDVRLESQFTLPKLLALRVFTIALLICWLYHYKKQTLLPISKPFLILTLVFASWLILSTVKAYHIPTALWGDYGWYNGLYTQLNYLVLMLIVAALPIDRVRILKAFVIAASLVALYACLQWLGLDPLKFPHERPTSTIGNAVPMAAMVALAIPFCLYFSIKGSKLWYAPLTICLIAIGLSGSRGVQLAVLASGVMFFLSTARHKILTYIVIAVIAIAGITAYSIHSDRYNIKNALSSDSVQQRVQYAKTARAIVKKHPLVGVGPDNFIYAYPMYRAKALPTEKNLQATVVHNGYLDLAVKSGIPALLLYLGLVGFVLFKLDKSKGLLATAFMASILGFLIQDFTGWYHIGLTPFFWIILGLAMSNREIETMKPKFKQLVDIFKTDKETIDILKSCKFKPSNDPWLITNKELQELRKRDLARS